MKKFFLFFVLVLTLLLTGCSMKAAIPDLKDKTEEEIDSIMKPTGIIYRIEYEVNNEVEVGKVIRTEPSIGTKVDDKTEVIIYVSGSDDINTTQGSYIEWDDVTNNSDNWEYYAPKIKDGVLTIRCDVVQFGANVEWIGDEINGVASLYKDLSNPIELKLPYQKKSFAPYESQEINIVLPMEAIGNKKPTTLYFAFKALVNGNPQDIKINFRLVW